MSDFQTGIRHGRIPLGDEKYHNTWLLLRKYRDVVWSLEVSVAQSKRSFQHDFGMTIEEYLDSMYMAGVDFSNESLADRARALQKSYRMLKLVDTAVEIMRTKHRQGEQYYWVVYYTYLAPQEFDSVDEIIEVLRVNIRDISRRTYYRKRREAIEILSNLLWGYTDQETLEIMKGFLQS